jgi:hypothetical protein
VRAQAPLNDVELLRDLVRRAIAVRAETVPERGQTATVRLGRVAVGGEVDVADGRVGVDERRRDPP